MPLVTTVLLCGDRPGAIRAALLVIASAFAAGYLLGDLDPGEGNVIALERRSATSARRPWPPTQSFGDPRT
jgi:hypothetical protein